MDNTTGAGNMNYLFNIANITGRNANIIMHKCSVCNKWHYTL